MTQPSMVSLRPAAVYRGTSRTIPFTITSGGETKTVQVDRKLAQKIFEAQTRYTVTNDDGSKSSYYGGQGIVKDEMQSIFSSLRDIGSNGRGGYRVISESERVLLKMLDAARDDRFNTSFTDSDGYKVDVKLTGFGNRAGGDGTTAGAEGQFLAQMKALKVDIAKRNLFGTPIPSVAPSNP